MLQSRTQHFWCIFDKYNHYCGATVILYIVTLIEEIATNKNNFCIILRVSRKFNFGSQPGIVRGMSGEKVCFFFLCMHKKYLNSQNYNST